MRCSRPSNALATSFLCCTYTMAERDLTSIRNSSMSPPLPTGGTDNTKDLPSPRNSNASGTEFLDSGPYWKRVARRRRVVMKEMKERRKQRESYLFPMRGMAGERFGQHVDLIQKQNANFGISAIFMAGLQAQLLSILPSDPNDQHTAIVWVTALFYTAVLLDTLAALFSIWSTLMYNNAVAAPITNLFDEGDPQNKSKRAIQWGKPLQPYTALVNVRAGYVLQSIFAWFFIPGIACMVRMLTASISIFLPCPLGLGHRSIDFCLVTTAQGCRLGRYQCCHTCCSQLPLLGNLEWGDRCSLQPRAQHTRTNIGKGWLRACTNRECSPERLGFSCPKNVRRRYRESWAATTKL